MSEVDQTSNNVTKGCFIAIAFLEALIMGLIPVKSKRFRESPAILGIANAFSGGVFLAIALMHIMPEQVEAYEEVGEVDFPMPFLILVIGYTLILIIDKVLFDTHDIFETHEHGEGEHANSVEFKDPRMRRASEAITQSMHNMIRQSFNGQADAQNINSQLRASQVMVENALKANMGSMVKRSEKFAARLSMSRNKNDSSDGSRRASLIRQQEQHFVQPSPMGEV